MALDDAVVMAAQDLSRKVHEGQKRKGTDVSYFDAHREPVARLVEGGGGGASQVAAAYLHDAAEDGGGEAMLRRISEEVDPVLATMVRDLSDSLVDTSSGGVKEDWTLRKTRYLVAELVAGVERFLSARSGDPDSTAATTWDAPDRRVDGDDPRTDRYRRLQSWWHHAQLAAEAGSIRRARARARVGSARSAPSTWPHNWT